jgi:small GTP-binding protein
MLDEPAACVHAAVRAQMAAHYAVDATETRDNDAQDTSTVDRQARLTLSTLVLRMQAHQAPARPTSTESDGVAGADSGIKVGSGPGTGTDTEDHVVSESDTDIENDAASPHDTPTPTAVAPTRPLRSCAPLYAAMERRSRAARVLRCGVLGRAGGGKTSLALRYVHNEFSLFAQPTLSIDFITTELRLSDGRAVALQIWDTAGQERFDSLCETAVRSCECALVVFALDDATGFADCAKWIARLRERDAALPIVLVGNKLDVVEALPIDGRPENFAGAGTQRLSAVSARRCVDAAAAQRFARERAVAYVETSARTAHEVAAAFVCVAELATARSDAVEARERAIDRAVSAGERAQLRVAHPGATLVSSFPSDVVRLDAAMNGAAESTGARWRVPCCR